MYFVETSSGRKWHYDLEGRGPAILFIHGWGVDLRIWRQQFKYFSRSYQVLAIDLPGHGKSSWQRLSLEDMARDLYEIIHRSGIKKLHVVASSFGGLVALKLYALSPAIIASLVFVGSQPKFMRSKDYPYGLTTTETKKLSSQLETDYPLIMHIFFRSLFTTSERESRRFKWIQTFRKADTVPDQKALAELLKVLEREDLRDDFKGVKVPIQFFNGREDYFFPSALAEYLKKLNPGVQFKWFEKSGHFPFLIQPHQFNKILEKFLNSLKENVRCR
jgi:pimeloyl-ACP methyl ester esterase